MTVAIRSLPPADRFLFSLCAAWLAASAAAAPAQQVDAIDWRAAQVDLSFLNAAERPAGRRGFVRAQGETLVFADGTPARFWGVNLTAQAVFGTDKASAREHAARLSRLGFNLVRLHHHDSFWTSPNIFGADPAGGSRKLDPAMLDRIDWWIRCLRDEGIYVWLDLHVQRQLRRQDGIQDFDDMAKGREAVELKGFNYVNADIEQAMKAFNEAYLSHVNAYTGLSYKDDPAIAAVLLTNENDLTQHYGNALLPNQKVPLHSARYMALAREFAQQHGLPADKVWRSWEPGVSRIFLNDLERRFDERMISHLRGIGVKVPIATTNWWGGQPSSLPALTCGDVMDVHVYEDSGTDGSDPRREGSALYTAAIAQVAGKPVTVSEWNMAKFPSADRQDQPLRVAAMASRQGWDALMHYAYAQVPLQDTAAAASNWHAFNDPSRLAMMPAAALLYRQQHVKPSGVVHAWAPSAEQLFDTPSEATLATLRIAAERGRLVTVLPKVPALGWLRTASKPPGSLDAMSAGKSLAPGTSVLDADTGEVRRDWSAGVLTISTSRTQAAAGRLGGRTIELPDVRVRIASSRAGMAVQSLDGRPIGESAHLLVSIAAPTEPSSPERLPFLAELPTGDVELHASPGLESKSQPGVQINYIDGRYVVHFDGKAAVHWVSLRRPARSGR